VASSAIAEKLVSDVEVDAESAAATNSREFADVASPKHGRRRIARLDGAGSALNWCREGSSG
jgi:hypothetical protein